MCRLHDWLLLPVEVDHNGTNVVLATAIVGGHGENLGNLSKVRVGEGVVWYNMLALPPLDSFHSFSLVRRYP